MDSHAKWLETRFWNDLDNGYMIDDAALPPPLPRTDPPLTAAEIRYLTDKVFLQEGGATYPFSPIEHVNTPTDVLHDLTKYGLFIAARLGERGISFLIETRFTTMLKHPHLAAEDETTIKQFIIMQAALK